MAGGPVQSLTAFLSEARRRYIVGRLFFVLTAALAADMGLTLLNMGMYSLLGRSVPLPFFFEMVAAALLLRELPSLGSVPVAERLDRDHLLKDRLYSFTQFAGRSDVPEDLRQAQAAETLSRVDLDVLRQSIRTRPPLLILPLLAASIMVSWLTWNADYAPPGITSRVARQVLPHPSDLPAQTAGDNEADGSAAGKQPDARGQQETDEAAGDDKQRGSGERDKSAEAAPEVTLDAEEDQASGVAGAAGGGGEGQGAGGTDRAIAAPDVIQSVPVTAAVSRPVPPTLAVEASRGFRSLPEATSFLSLIPGQKGKPLADLDDDTIDNFRNGLEGVPERYHDQLNLYYEVLRR